MKCLSEYELEGEVYLFKDKDARKEIEKLKNNGGGSSGGNGASSWEDLGEKTETIEVLPEATWTTPENQFPGMFMPDVPINIDLDKTYIVNWNGTEYTTVPYFNEYSGLIVLGNPTYVGGPPNADIYGIVIDEGIITEAFDVNLASKVTVSITSVGTTITPIPDKYLPAHLQFGEIRAALEFLPPSAATEYTNPMFGKVWEILKAPKVEVGKTYTISYNGDQYECVCYPAPDGFSEDKNAVAMGNFSVAGGENTGEPFAMLISFAYQRIDIIDLSSASSVTVSISGEGVITKPIEGKYLPEGTPWIEEIGMVEVLAETTIQLEDGEYQSEGAISLTAGEAYTVNWNGVEYTCIGQDASSLYGNGAACVGDVSNYGLSGNGEPFIVLVAPNYGANGITVILALDGSTEVVVSVVQHSAVAHKLDNRCLDFEYIEQKIAPTVDKKLNTKLNTKADKSAGVFYIEGESNTAGEWLGVHDDITEYFPGLMVAYKNDVAGISGGTTLNINGLGAVPVVRNATTAVTTTYAAKSIVFLTYTEDDGEPYWKVADYDTNTKTSAGTSNNAGTKLYLVGAKTQTSGGTTTYTNKNCYIGTDNRLYSNGKAVVTEDAITLTSPNGTKFALTVSDDGTLSATKA